VGGGEGVGGAFGIGGGLAQRLGAAGAAGELAPDDRRFQHPPRLVANADPPGRHIGAFGLGFQHFQIEQFEQGAVAAGESVLEGELHPVGDGSGAPEQAPQFATKLEHRASPIEGTRIGTEARVFDGCTANPEPNGLQEVNAPTWLTPARSASAQVRRPSSTL
jgi:hypothetical protein